MRQGWLESSTGVNVVAIGLVAIMFSIVVFTVQDLWILVTGTPYGLHGLRGGWYLLLETRLAKNCDWFVFNLDGLAHPRTVRWFVSAGAKDGGTVSNFCCCGPDF